MADLFPSPHGVLGDGPGSWWCRCEPRRSCNPAVGTTLLGSLYQYVTAKLDLGLVKGLASVEEEDTDSNSGI